MDALEFFYDDSVEDFVPVIKLNLVEVSVDTRQIHVNWTREAIEDLATSIDRDIIARLMEMGVNNPIVHTEAGNYNWNENEEL